MAHSKQARKRIRQNGERRLRNRSAKSALRTAIKTFKKDVPAGDAEVIGGALKTVQKRVDKSVQRGIIRKGAGSRIKSRLNAQAKKASAAE